MVTLEQQFEYMKAAHGWDVTYWSFNVDSGPETSITLKVDVEGIIWEGTTTLSALAAATTPSGVVIDWTPRVEVSVVEPVAQAAKPRWCAYAGKREPRADWVALPCTNNPHEAITLPAVLHRVQENGKREQAAISALKRQLREWPTCSESGNALEIISEEADDVGQMHGAWYCADCEARHVKA